MQNNQFEALREQARIILGEVDSEESMFQKFTARRMFVINGILANVQKMQQEGKLNLSEGELRELESASEEAQALGEIIAFARLVLQHTAD